MKNRVIKKIMAYLLVGAMVITTPMTASASELQKAYSTEDGGSGKESNSNSGSNSNSNSVGKEIPVDVPGIVNALELNILGMTMDKSTVDLEVEKTDSLKVRVLFDDWNAEDEEMDWVTKDEKEKIEQQIKWYSSDSNIVNVSQASDDPTRAVIKGVANGQATIHAWIETDGFGYSNNPNRPTQNDIMATTTVTVIGEKYTIEPLELTAYPKHKYKLADKVMFKYAKNSKPASETGETVVFSNLLDSNKNTPAKTKATLTDDGLLTIGNKASKEEVYTCTVVSSSGEIGTVTITIGEAVPATSVTIENVIDKVDLGSDNYIQFITAKLSPDNSTDAVEWKSNKPKIVTVEPVDTEGKEAKLKALATGKATITATATSGKKATVAITVAAENISIKLVETANTFTGKDLTLKAEAVGKENKNSIPYASIKGGFKWSIDNKKNASIKPAKDSVIIKPKTLLSESEEEDGKNVASVTITVKTTKLKSNDKKECKVKITQSDIADITVDEITKTVDLENDIVASNPIQILGKMPVTKSTTRKIYVGKDYKYVPHTWVNKYENSNLKLVEDPEQAAAIAWTVSGKAATISSDGKLTAVSAGKATITASYVSLKYDAKGKAKPQLKKKTIPVQVIQNAKEIGFKTPIVIKNPTKNGSPQKVTFTISSVLPKKATYNITDWKVLAVKGGTKLDVAVDGSKDTNAIKLDARDKNGNFKKSATITLPGKIEKDTVIKVGAYTDGGAVAFGYIYVTDKTTKPYTVKLDEEVVDKNTSITLASSGQLTTSFSNGEAPIWTGGGSQSYKVEPITYVVDKNSVKFVSVTKSGKVTGLKSTGKKTATINIMSASGKKLTSVKIKVN